MIARDYGYLQTLPISSVDSSGHEPLTKESMEAKIIRLAKQGDYAAFAGIYQLYCRRIFALCMRMVRNRTEAEDLTQDAFLVVFRKIGTFRGESSFSTWLHRVAVNVVLMHIRKKKLSDSPERVAEVNDDGGRQDWQHGSPHSRGGLIDRFNLERAIDKLTPTCKLVFMLHDVQGYNHQEIARLLDSTVGTCKGRLHRARSQLRELLLGDQRLMSHEPAV